MWQNATQQASSSENYNNSDVMLYRTCPTCGCAEEQAAGLPSYFQMRLLRTTRVIAVTLVLLCAMVMALLGLHLLRPLVPSHQSKAKGVEATSPSESVMGKLTAGKNESCQSVVLTLRKEPRTEWQYDHGTSYKKGDFTFSNGNLTVPIKGLYKVYLQITFDYNHENESHETICKAYDGALKITVQYFSPSYQRELPLMQSRDTERCESNWIKTMYTSRTFKLEAGTKLSVIFGPTELGVRQDTMSFFGTELLEALPE